MSTKDAFSSCHPVVNVVYFLLVIMFTMFFMHPVCLVISLVCGLVYSLQLGGPVAIRRQLRFLIPMMLMAALINPAFNHAGATVLCYLPGGKSLTLESILYGLSAAGLLAAVILWFSCYSTVMTSDKFVYLFGRIIPALSLVLSMTLRFVPRFVAQLRVVSEAQKCVGRDAATGSVVRRIQKGTTILSIMTTWALENAIETADSMKSRGYGLPGRTAFSIYRFGKRDRLALAWICGCGAVIVTGWIAGGARWQYYPDISGSWTLWSAALQMAYLALCLTPVILQRKEMRLWKHFRSEI